MMGDSRRSPQATDQCSGSVRLAIPSAVRRLCRLARQSMPPHEMVACMRYVPAMVRSSGKAEYPLSVRLLTILKCACLPPPHVSHCNTASVSLRLIPQTEYLYGSTFCLPLRIRDG